jgi:hypothetical protein
LSPFFCTILHIVHSLPRDGDIVAGWVTKVIASVPTLPLPVPSLPIGWFLRLMTAGFNHWSSLVSSCVWDVQTDMHDYYTDAKWDDLVYADVFASVADKYISFLPTDIVTQIEIKEEEPTLRIDTNLFHSYAEHKTSQVEPFLRKENKTRLLNFLKNCEPIDAFAVLLSAMELNPPSIIEVEPIVTDQTKVNAQLAELRSRVSPQAASVYLSFEEIWSVISTRSDTFSFSLSTTTEQKHSLIENLYHLVDDRKITQDLRLSLLSDFLYPHVNKLLNDELNFK